MTNYITEKSETNVSGKIREWCKDKISFIKNLSIKPEFMGEDNPKMRVASDGTKCCFMFNTDYKAAHYFAETLSKELGDVKVDEDSFIGYKTLYVPSKNYEEAIQKGLNILLINPIGFWVDFYNEKSYYDFEQVLTLQLHKSFINKEGEWKVGVETIVKGWVKKLEGVLGTELRMYKEPFRRVIIGINRETDAHLKHEDILNKIRNSKILENTPFEGYAIVDYYGKYVK